MRKTTIVITTLWVINEIIQAFKLLNDSFILSFIVSHISSFYGAIIFFFLISYLGVKKIFLFTPIGIEIFQSWLACRCLDFWDITFSLAGIIFAYFIVKIEQVNKKKGYSDT